MSRVIAVLVAAFAVGGCSASLPSLSFLKSAPSLETLRLESDPPGAEAKTSQGSSCRTPCELKLEASTGFSVTFSRDGYQSQTVQVALETPPAASGPPDLMVTSNSPRLDPNPVYVELLPGPATPSGKAKPAKRPRPKPVASTAPTSKRNTSTASAPSTAPSAPPAQSVTVEVSAPPSNYPWR